MGSLFVEIGQCGCQIGAKLNPLLSNSYYCTRDRHPNRLHAIMIDTQPKVLKKYLQKTPKWLDIGNIKYFEHGRGNNWSYGYLHEIPERKINTGIMSQHKQFSHKGQNQLIKRYVQQNKRISQFVLQKVRKQLQTVDCAMAINVISSLGGGTGSGLGTKTIERLSEQFNIDILSHVVLPNMSGQTPLQIYNCLLSLSVIQQHSSAIFPIQNQKLLDNFRSKNIEYFITESLETINEQIAKNISAFIKINEIPGYDRFYTDIVSSHVLSHDLKYLNLTTAESNSKVQPWDQCFDQLLNKIKIYNQDYSNREQKVDRQFLLSGQIIAIGKQVFQSQKKYFKKIQNILNPYQTSIQFNQISMQGMRKNITVKQRDKNQESKQAMKQKQKHRAVLVMNHTNITRYLSYLCESGKLKYENKAYLWHYEYVDIQQSIQKVQNTIDQYQYYLQIKN